MNQTPHIEVEEILSIAKAAGAVIMQQLTPGIEVEAKGDSSPVTIADKNAHELIKQRLLQKFDIPVLSEEDTLAEQQAAGKSNLKWVVDPLDGTQTAIAYAHGEADNIQFGVHIGLVKNGVPILGVAFFPAMADGKGIAYFTGDDGKAYKQTAEGRPKVIHVTKPPLKEGGLRVATHFNLKRRPESIGGREYTSVPGVGGQRLCLVAEGAADLADMNDIPLAFRDKYAYKDWDFAAGHAILKAAGGELVSKETGQPTTHDRPDFRQPGTYAGGVEMLNFLNLADVSQAAGRARA